MAIGQSIQAFSRVPGTAGPFYVLSYVACMIGQFWYYATMVETSGEQDLIGIGLPMLIQMARFVYVILSTFSSRFKGVEFEVFQSGIGILDRSMPNQSLPTVNFASDMLIAAIVTVSCFVLNSPILGRWYLFVSGAIMLTHLWMDWQNRTELRRLDEATKRARNLSARFNAHRRS